jgi:hypothetical protein
LVTLRPVGDFLAAGGLGDWEIWADGRQRAISRPVGGFEDGRCRGVAVASW